LLHAGPSASNSGSGRAAEARGRELVAAVVPPESSLRRRATRGPKGFLYFRISEYMRKPLHLAGYCLNPSFYYQNRKGIEK
jgi:hypothetical protein